MTPAGLDPKRTLVVVDLWWWLNKAFHARGIEGMAACVVGWIVALLSDPAPAMVAVAVDSVGPTWRHKMTAMLDPDQRYKAGREPRPPEFYSIANRVLEIIALHRIPILAAEGWEADDVFGAVKQEAAGLGCYVVMLTADKDMGQLVDATTFMWDGRDSLVGPSEIEAKWGVPPCLIRDLLAVMGDDSDNIKGVLGLGQVKAAAVLRLHDSLDAALAAPAGFGPSEATIKEAEKAKAKAKKSGDEAALKGATADLEGLRDVRNVAAWTAILQASRERVELARKLVTLDTAAPIAWNVEELPVGGFDEAELRTAYLALGFSALAREVRTYPKASFV